MLWLAIVALMVVAGVVALRFAKRVRRYAVHTEPRRIEVTRHVVESADLAPGLDGMTICQVSDLHIARAVRNRREVAEAIRGVSVDLFVFTGDLITGAAVPAMLQWFDEVGGAALPAIAVLGNAEHKPWVPTALIVSELEVRGIKTLVNQVMRYERNGAVLQIVGVDDPHTCHADFPQAYAGADPGLWTLLLCHSPDGAADLNGFRADLMLCGHTHAGQIRLPVVGALQHNLKRVRRLIGGWYCGDDLARRARAPIGRTRMYVSRGLGAGTFPGRLLCPPELPIFELRRTE